MNILIIDNNFLFVQELKEALSEFEFNISVSLSEESTVNVLKVREINLVLINIETVSSTRDGVEFWNNINDILDKMDNRKTKDLAQVPAVFYADDILEKEIEGLQNINIKKDFLSKNKVK